MAIIKLNFKGHSLNRIINYACNPRATRSRLITGINVLPQSAIPEMNVTKKVYQKTGGRLYLHIIHSFAPDTISPEDANYLGMELISNLPFFNGYEALVATHTNKNHIHNHIIINSVSYINGEKLNIGPSEVDTLRNLSDVLCIAHGLDIPLRHTTDLLIPKHIKFFDSKLKKTRNFITKGYIFAEVISDDYWRKDLCQNSIIARYVGCQQNAHTTLFQVPQIENLQIKIS